MLSSANTRHIEGPYLKLQHCLVSTTHYEPYTTRCFLASDSTFTSASRTSLSTAPSSRPRSRTISATQEAPVSSLHHHPLKARAVKARYAPSLHLLRGRPPVPSSRSPAVLPPCALSRGSSAPSRASSAPSESRYRGRPGPTHVQGTSIISPNARPRSPCIRGRQGSRYERHGS